MAALAPSQLTRSLQGRGAPPASYDTRSVRHVQARDSGRDQGQQPDASDGGSADSTSSWANGSTHSSDTDHLPVFAGLGPAVACTRFLPGVAGEPQAELLVGPGHLGGFGVAQAPGDVRAFFDQGLNPADDLVPGKSGIADALAAAHHTSEAIASLGQAVIEQTPRSGSAGNQDSLRVREEAGVAVA
jgi:hypothetical protein